MGQNNATATSSLFDPEGFPRSDIDVVSGSSVRILKQDQLQKDKGTEERNGARVQTPCTAGVGRHLLSLQYSIRHARASLARLRTDLRQVTELLTTALEAAFAVPPS
jgi:hypothetical protein